MKKNNFRNAHIIIAESILLFILFFPVHLIHGQIKEEGSYQKLSLNQALEIAKQNYPSIKAKESGVKGADQELSATRAQYMPALLAQEQVSFATVNSVRGAFFPNEGMALPISGGVSGDPTNMQGVFGSYSSLVLNWKFFNFGKIRANVNSAKAGLTSSQLDYENELFQHQIKVADAYLLLLVTQKIVNVQRSNLERVKSLRAAIIANTNSGLRPGVDSSYVNAEYSKAYILLMESQKNETAQRLKLAELTGSSNGNIIVDSMSFYNTLPIVATSESITIDNNPLLKFKKSELEIMRARAIAVKRSYAPSISLLAAGGGRGSGAANSNPNPVTGKLDLNSNFAQGLNFKAYNYFFGVSMLWNILDYPRIRHLYKGQKFITERDNYMYEEQKLILNRQMENVGLQIKLTTEQAHQAPIQLGFAKSAYAQATSRYQSGLATLPEVAQNFYILNRAEVDQSIAYNNVWRSLLMKSAVVGDLNLFISQVK
jgi:outer membrane protein TolC